MRDKFSELIDAGVASYTYKPVAGNIPEQDDICRIYNNIYSIPSDTHMSFIDGHRYVTGHILHNHTKWMDFCISCTWGGVDFRNTTGSVMNFLANNGLKLEQVYLNGDIAYEAIPVADPSSEEMPTAICPMCYTTTESQIPQPIDLLTVDHNSLKIKECFEGSKNSYEVAKKLNESLYIKGDNWTVFENNIIGTVSNSNCILKVFESGDEYIRYVIKFVPGPSDKDWCKIEAVDRMFDKHLTGLFDKKSFKPLNSSTWDNDTIIDILKTVNSNPVKVIKTLKSSENYEIYGKGPYDDKMKIRPAKYKHSDAWIGSNF